MSGGLVALLDDVAAIARIAAASLDDIGAAAGKAGAKAIGVVVDDTAVTPRYVAGFTPDRELPIIWRIAVGSLRNKILFILPVTLLLSQFLPVAITPLLMIGGLYLCFEGAEKLHEMLGGHHESAAEEAAELSSTAHEEHMISGAIRTDFILSAEIMAISLGEVASQPFVTRTISLIAVAFMITALVYGVVALIVKMDDFGLKLAQSGSGTGGSGGLRALGRGLVKGMPVVMSALSTIGTAAMLWVGGHMIVDGLAKFGIDGPAHLLHNLSHQAAHLLHLGEHTVGWNTVVWLVEALSSAVVGVVLGAIIVGILQLLPGKKTSH